MVTKKRSRPSAGGAAANKRRREKRERLSSAETATPSEAPEYKAPLKRATIRSAFQSLWGTDVPLPSIPDSNLSDDEESGAEAIIEDGSDAEGGAFEDLPDEYEDAEAVVEEGGGSSNSKRVIDADAISALLETGDLRAAINLFRSCLRGLISVVRSTGSFKRDKLVTRKGQAENENRKRVTEKLERITEAAPYKFAEDVENLANVAVQSVNRIAALVGEMSKSNLKASSKYFGSFWADVVVFLENSGGARNPNARIVCASLGDELVLCSLLDHPALINRFHAKFVDVVLRMDSELQEAGLKCLAAFFKALVSKTHGRDAKIQRAISECLKRTVSGLAHVTSKRMAAKALGLQRRTVSALILIVNQLQKVRPKVVYDVAFVQLRSLVLGAARVISKEGSKKKDLRVEQLNNEIFSWSTLFVSYLWISVIMLETPDSKFALARQAEGWAVLLMTLGKKCLTHLPSYPFLLKAMANLISLSNASKAHLPIGMMLLQMALAMNKEPSSRDAKSAKLIKAVRLDNLLRLEENELAAVRVQEDLFASCLNLIIDYLVLLARHPAFPETTFILLTHLKKLAKTNKESTNRMRLKNLVTCIEKTARQIETERLDMRIEDLPQSLFVFGDEIFKKFDIAQLAKKRSSDEHYMSEQC